LRRSDPPQYDRLRSFETAVATAAKTEGIADAFNPR
jgi:hypothetical protein